MKDDRGDDGTSERLDSVSRRGVLQQTGVLAGGIAGLPTVTGGASAQSADLTFQETVTFGFPAETPGEQWNDVHVDVIAHPDTDFPNSLYDALQTGFEQLYHALGDWFAGCKVRCYELDYDLDPDDRVASMAAAFDDLSESTVESYGLRNFDRLYHFSSPPTKLDVRNETQSPRNGASPWAADSGRPISSIGDANHHLNELETGHNNYQVRAFHQALHKFVDPQKAIDITGLDAEDVDDPPHGYDAQHTLGTVDEEGRRTVMADLALVSNDIPGYDGKDGYEDEAKAGGVCGSDHWGTTSWPRLGDLRFSECTKAALRYTALDYSDSRIVGELDKDASSFDRTVGVDVEVVDADGEPVADRDVTLTDRYTQHRSGTTGETGHVLFWEGVGPSPCNPLSVSLSDEDVRTDAGCHNGGTVVEASLTVPAEGEETEHTLTIDGEGLVYDRNYTFEVSGSIEKSTANGASRNGNDEIDDGTATGSVRGGKDSYTFTGELMQFRGSGVTVTLDGEEIDTAEYGPTHTITIESPDDTDRSYYLEVDQNLAKSTENDASTNRSDTLLPGNTATGNVVGGRDSYTFDGELDVFQGEEVTVYVDGREVDPATYARSRTLTLDGSGASREDYYVDVADDLQKSDALGASINLTDGVDGSTATGHLRAGRDSYTFTGELLQCYAEDGVTAYLDNEEVDLSDYGTTHTITISSHDDTDREYEFEAEALLRKSTANGASRNGSDDRSGTVASGNVVGGKDSYTFGGSLERFQGEGVTVELDGEAVDPADHVRERTLTLEGTGVGQDHYSVTVDRNLRKSEALGATTDGADDVDGTTADGSVWSGRDSYTFDGELLNVEAEDVTVWLDGEAVEPEQYTSAAVTVDGPSSGTVGDSLTYTASVVNVDGGALFNWLPPLGDGETFEEVTTKTREFSSPGTHEVEVEVAADEAETVTDSMTVEIEERERPEPTVEISGPSAGGTGDELEFSATVSNFSGNPDYNWQAPVGDGNSNFDDGPSTTHTFTTEDEYTASVAVTSDRGESAWASKTVVIDDAGTVGLTADDTTVTTGDVVELNASATGFDGTPQFQWEGASGSGSSTTASWDSAGTYTVEVTANDGSETATDSATVSVRDPRVTVSGPSSADTGDELRFTAELTEFRGSPEFNWQAPVADGNSYFDDGPSTTHTFSEPGQYEAAVAVQSDRGEGASDSITVDVDEPYTSVSVGLDADDTTVTTRESVNFDASASGGDGSIDYSWSGASGSGASISEYWTSGGTHTVTVTASDGRTSDSASVDVSVRDPSVSISGPSNAEVGDSLQFSASVSDFRGNPDYNWQAPVGDGNSYFDDGPSESHTFSSSGTYTASVAVTSDRGESASASMTVDVDPDSSSSSSGSSSTTDSGSDSTSDDSSSSTDDSSGSDDSDLADWADDTNDNGQADCVDRRNYQNCG